MSDNKKRLLAVLAHPDDESMGLGGTFAKYHEEGVETYLICATKGERGRYGLEEHPGPEIVGQTREKELLEAAGILGIKEVHFLGYMDGELDQVDPGEIQSRIARLIRRIQPQVILTFGAEGGYGHTDHIAISQFTGGAAVLAADPSLDIQEFPPCTVSKLYYMAWPASKWNSYKAAFKELSRMVDGVKRVAPPFPDWAITTRIDTTDYWKTAWEAIQCHKTQIAVYSQLDKLTDEQHIALWGQQEFYRVFSLVNGGRKLETDLFEGLP